MRQQQLTADTVDRHIDATPEALYAIVADVTRTPELTGDIVRCEWLDGATEAVVGARFLATNRQGRGPEWKNSPVITTATPGREIAWARTEKFAGTSGDIAGAQRELGRALMAQPSSSASPMRMPSGPRM